MGEKTSQRADNQKGSTRLHQQTVKEVLLKITSEYCRAWSNNTGVGRDLNSERIIRFGLVGSPDIIGTYKGLFLGIEIKTGNAKQTDMQKNFQKMIDGLGGIYILCKDIDVEQINDIVEQRYQYAQDVRKKFQDSII